MTERENNDRYEAPCILNEGFCISLSLRALQMAQLAKLMVLSSSAPGRQVCGEPGGL